MFKELVRREILEYRSAHPLSRSRNVRKAILEQSKQYIKSVVKRKQNYTLCLYDSQSNEIDTSLIREHFKRYYIPLMTNTLDKSEFVSYDDSKPNHSEKDTVAIDHIVDEVKREDGMLVILVPSLAVDFKKNRLGRGRGWYDYLLSVLYSCNVTVKTFTFVYSEEVLPILPVEKHDIKLDKIFFIRQRDEEKISIECLEKDLDGISIEHSKLRYRRRVERDV